MSRLIAVSLFVASASFVLPSSSTSAELGMLWLDLDGDGYRDLLRFAPRQGAEVWLNDGEGGLELTERAELPAQIVSAASLDVGSDGVEELLLSTPRETMLLGFQDGQFTVRERLPQADHIQLLDFDEDGLSDLVLGAQVFRQTESGDFRSLPLTPWTTDPASNSTIESETSRVGGLSVADSGDHFDDRGESLGSLASVDAPESGSPGAKDLAQAAAGGPEGQGPSVQGNVGINKSAPRTELHIRETPGAAESIARIMVESTETQNVSSPAEIVFMRTSQNPEQVAAVGMDHETRDFYIHVNGEDRFSIDQDGSSIFAGPAIFANSSIFAENATFKSEVSVMDQASDETFRIDPDGPYAQDASLRLGSVAGGAVRMSSRVGEDRGGRISLHRTNGDASLYLDADNSVDGGAKANFYNSNGDQTLFLGAGDRFGSGMVNVYNDEGTRTVKLEGADDFSAGVIWVNARDGEPGIYLTAQENSSQGAAAYLYNSATVRTVEIDADYNNAGQIILYTSNGLGSIEMHAQRPSDEGALVWLRNADGNATITLDADYAGVGRVTTDELLISGGSDLAEHFDITSEGGEAEPGMVVSIDPDNPTQLQVSSRAYDRRVAGVVSGAGDVKPGMLMHQEGSVASGEYPVALVGRVYVWADASAHAIEPGDLLTSSDLPGHAMKVTDAVRAQGATLGKALTTLDSGQGLVLALVALQ